MKNLDKYVFCCSQVYKDPNKFSISMDDIEFVNDSILKEGYNTPIYIYESDGYCISESFCGKFGVSLPESVKAAIRHMYKADKKALLKYMAESIEDDLEEAFDWSDDVDGPEDEDDDDTALDVFKGYVSGRYSPKSSGSKEKFYAEFAKSCLYSCLSALHDRVVDGQNMTCMTIGYCFKSLGDSEEIDFRKNRIADWEWDTLNMTISKDEFFDSGRYSLLAKAVEDAVGITNIKIGELFLRCDLYPVVCNVAAIEDFYTGIGRIYRLAYAVEEQEDPISSDEYSLVCGMYAPKSLNQLVTEHGVNYAKKVVDCKGIRNFFCNWLKSSNLFTVDEIKIVAKYLTDDMIVNCVNGHISFVRRQR